MPEPTVPRPARPSDLYGVPLHELLDAWHSHISRLVDDRHGLGRPLSPGRLASHALDALLISQALVDSLQSTRFVTVLDALGHGATVGQVATATGLDNDEVSVGLQSWADGQLRQQLMTPAQYEAVQALLVEGERQR